MYEGLFPFYLLDYHLGGDSVEAVIVSAEAGAVAEDGAGAAGHVELHHVARFLLPAEESGVGMGGSPHADRAESDERSQMHVGGIHREHGVAMA